MQIIFQYQEMRTEFIKQYGAQIQLNDPAHQLEHLDIVYENALVILSKAKDQGTELYVDLPEIFLVAYFHDLFSRYRNIHHRLASEFIRNTDCPLVSTLCLMSKISESRKRVADACAEHRASFEGKYSSDLSKLMAAADQGYPKQQPEDVNQMLARSMRYTRSKMPQDTEANMIRNIATTHIKDKFGRNGYAIKNELIKTLYAAELEQRYQTIDALGFV